MVYNNHFDLVVRKKFHILSIVIIIKFLIIKNLYKVGNLINFRKHYWYRPQWFFTSKIEQRKINILFLLFSI